MQLNGLQQLLLLFTCLPGLALVLLRYDRHDSCTPLSDDGGLVRCEWRWAVSWRYLDLPVYGERVSYEGPWDAARRVRHGGGGQMNFSAFGASYVGQFADDAFGGGTGTLSLPLYALQWTVDWQPGPSINDAHALSEVRVLDPLACAAIGAPRPGRVRLWRRLAWRGYVGKTGAPAVLDLGSSGANDTQSLGTFVFELAPDVNIDDGRLLRAELDFVEPRRGQLRLEEVASGSTAAVSFRDFHATPSYLFVDFADFFWLHDHVHNLTNASLDGGELLSEENIADVMLALQCLARLTWKAAPAIHQPITELAVFTAST